MKTYLLEYVLVIAVLSCTQMSEVHEDESAGFNGGFEIIKKNLPVNWMVYTCKTKDQGEYTISTNSFEFVEGKRSLKFDVKHCTNTGGRFSPGITQELDAKPGKSYLISFWVKNSGCEFGLRAGGITTTTGEEKILLRTSDTLLQWKKFEIPMKISDKHNRMRVEFTVFSPGTLYLDDVIIQELKTKN